MNIFQHICKIGLLTFVALPAWSATISLSPSTQSVAAPELGDPAVFFQIDVLLDAADVDGYHPAIIDGGYTIMFDPTQVEAPVFIMGSLTPPAFLDDPVLPPPLTTPIDCGGSPACVKVPLIVGAPEISVLGSWMFEVKTGVAPGTAINIGVDNALLFDGLSLSNWVNTACAPNISCANASFPPIYSGATVNVVPIPASVWLFGSALGALVWVRRRKVVLAQ
jgi:hypothetical protein